MVLSAGWSFSPPGWSFSPPTSHDNPRADARSRWRAACFVTPRHRRSIHLSITQEASMRMLLVLAVALFTLAGCGVPPCSGTACNCASGMSCTFDTCGATTSGCRFNCEANSTCAGTCGPGCNVTCSGTSCTHTVGTGSNVVCSAGVCNITCEGACSVVGTVNLTCNGGTTSGPGGCT